jgi:nitroreductase
LILEAGRLALTAVNYQPQRIIVLDTPDNLEKARQFTTFGYGDYLASFAQECTDEKKQHNTYFYNSPTALLVCYDNTVCWKRPSDGKGSGEMDATIVGGAHDVGSD